MGRIRALVSGAAVVAIAVGSLPAGAAIRWSVHTPPPTYHQTNAIAVGPDGTTYVAGEDHGFEQAFVRSYDSGGGERWRVNFGYEAAATDVDVSPTGDVFVVARVRVPGPFRESDITVARLNREGSILWTRRFGSPSGEYGGAIAIAPDGSVVVVGSTLGNIETGTAGNAATMFLARITAAGALASVRQFAYGPGDRSGTDVTVSGDGSVYAIGHTSEPGYQGAFVARYSSDFAPSWERLDRSDDVYPVYDSLDLDSSGRPYVAGNSIGAFGAFGGGGFLEAWTTAGADRWRRDFRCLGPCGTAASAMAVDTSGDVFVGGGFEVGGERVSMARLDGNGNDLAFPITRFETYPVGLAVNTDHRVFVAGATYLSQVADRANLVANPSFETATSPWCAFQGSLTRVANGSAPEGGYVARVARASGNYYSISDSPNASCQATVGSTRAGRVYRAEAFVRAATPNAVGETATLFARELAWDRTLVNDTGVPITLTTSFQRVVLTTTAVGDDNSMGVRIAQTGAGPGDAMEIDAVQLVEAPTVQAVIPGDGADRVSTLGSVRVRFSDTMDRPATEAATTLRRKSDAGSVPVSTSWDENTLVMTPTSPLDANTVFDVRVGTDARDELGTAVLPVQSSFTTGVLASAPSITTTARGSGWISIGWNAPASPGDAPISAYRVTASVSGAATEVPASAQRAVVQVPSALPQTFAVQALTSIGSGASATSGPVVATTQPVTYSTRWAASDISRLDASAVYLGVSREELQYVSVNVVEYIYGLAGVTEPSPITPPALNGAQVVATTWASTDQGPLVSSMERFALSPSEAQYIATAIVSYILALSGH